MTAPPGGASALSDECPINLHYSDPTPNTVDFDAIVRDGRRIQHRHTASTSAGVAAAAAAVTALALVLPHTSSHRDSVQAAAIYNSAIVKSFPPVDTVVVLGTYADSHQPYSSAIAWISQNGDLCYGSADMSTRSANRSILGLSCNTAPAELTTAGPTELLPGWPLFLPSPNKPGAWLGVGVLRGTAATVKVSANGQTADAPVHVLATPTGEAAGVYAVWLPAEPDGSIRSADITSVQAFDASGRLIAQIP